MEHPELEIWSAGKFRMSDVCNVEDTKRKMKVEVEERLYHDLARREWEGFLLTADERPTGRFYAVGPKVDAQDLKVLFYAPAPRKLPEQGLDDDDVIFDRNRLFYQSIYKDRLTAHRKMPGWEIYQRDGTPLTDSIEREDDRSRYFLPVLIWTTDGWVPTPEPSEISGLGEVTRRLKSNERRINHLAALLYLASYSADEFVTWQPYRNYAGHEGTTHHEGNGMDPAQAPALVIQKANRIVRARTCINIQKRLLENYYK
jgi:hypothetical protein